MVSATGEDNIYELDLLRGKTRVWCHKGFTERIVSTSVLGCSGMIRAIAWMCLIPIAIGNTIHTNKQLTTPIEMPSMYISMPHYVVFKC